jgi:uncharacterized cofD-like protein
MDKSYNYSQKIVVFGGGTGQFNLLRGMVAQNEPEYITAVPGTWDSGGSSGRLRTELGILPPGDARRCLIALMEDDEQREVALQLFEDRLEGMGNLEGQAVGNLILARLEKANAGQMSGMEAASILFGVKSHIQMISTNKLTLMSKTAGGLELDNEEDIDHMWKKDGYTSDDKITSIFFESPAKANPAVIDAIKSADKIVFSMGSLYGSILPHLLVPGIKEAITESSAKVYFIVNVMTERGQTSAFNTASDHVKEFVRYLGNPERLNFIIVNTKQLSEEVIEIYKQEGQKPVSIDKDECQRLAPQAQMLEGEIAEYFSTEHLLRHDTDKLASLILNS